MDELSHKFDERIQKERDDRVVTTKVVNFARQDQNRARIGLPKYQYPLYKKKVHVAEQHRRKSKADPNYVDPCQHGQEDKPNQKEIE